MNQVEVTGPGTVIAEKDDSGTVYYLWSFPVIVNGQAGVAEAWLASDKPEDGVLLENALIEVLEEDASDLGGISENDPGDEDGREDNLGDFGDDDGGDGALAGNDGDSGDSVCLSQSAKVVQYAFQNSARAFSFPGAF